MHDNRLLFILKKRGDFYHGHHYGSGHGLSSGLRNSCQFIVDMLNDNDIDAQLVVVDDNNGIDREVHRADPTHVIVEAFWVVPEKFDVLKRLHPNVHWIVRNHSPFPFLSMEGNALAWTLGYLARGIEVNNNCFDAALDMTIASQVHAAAPFGTKPGVVTYLPNYYPRPDFAQATTPHKHVEGEANIGCFGAIRPLKNQLEQAVAALLFTERKKLRLNFHINSSRVEGQAGPVLHNLRSLFAGAHNANLVEHEWLPHAQFLELLDTVDVSMQVSFSESFNIVTADAVARGVPIVVSDEISWLRPEFQVFAPTNTDSIAAGIAHAWGRGENGLVHQLHDLVHFDRNSRALWLERFRN